MRSSLKPGMNGVKAAILAIVWTVLLQGCAGGGLTRTETGGQTLPQEVTTEYLLTTAGFQRLPVNDETPKRQALLNGIPPGKLTTYTRDGEVYHAYADVGANTLYIGDDAAYQRYLGLTRNRKLCQQVAGYEPGGVLGVHGGIPADRRRATRQIKLGGA